MNLDFFYKLFPYKSLLQLDNNTLTVWWVVGTIAIFIFTWFQLLKIPKLTKTIKKYTENFSEEAISRDTTLKTIWQDYSQTFFEFHGERKTDHDSYDFFNENNLLTINTNLKLLSSSPSILVGLGILGTFVGLTYGITDFKTTSTEQIQISIQTLLSGMGTAFVSSIWGMLLSLVFTFFEKFYINSLHNSIHELCYQLNKKYKTSKEDERKMELIKQEKLLSDYFIFVDENNNRVKPANVFRDIFKESKEQTKALKAFSTDLSITIQAGFETILEDKLQKGIVQGIIPEFQSLKSAIEDLGKKLQDPTIDMMQNVLERFESTLLQMLNEIKQSISGSTKSELEQLAHLLSQAGGTLIDFPNKMNEMTKSLNENFIWLQKVIQDIGKETFEKSNESTEKMKKQIEDIADAVKDKFANLQSNEERLIGNQAKNLEISDKLLLSFNASIENMNQSTEIMKKDIENIADVLKDKFANLQSNEERLIGNQAKNLEISDKLLLSFNTSIANMNQSTEIMKKDIENIADVLKEKFSNLQANEERLIGNQAKNLEISDKLLLSFNASIESMNQSTEIMKKDIQNIAEVVKDKFSNLQANEERLIENQAKNLEISDKMLLTFNTSIENMNQSTGTIKNDIENMADVLKEKFINLQSNEERLIESQAKNLEISDKLLQTFNTSIESMNEIAISISSTITNFSKMQSELNYTSEQLKSISENINDSSDTFKESQLKFLQYSNQFLETNKRTVEEIQKSLLQAKEVSTDYTQKFSIIETGLKSIFYQIQNGLDSYKNTIGESIKTFLGEYTEALKKTAESLAGASGKQEEILEELTEQLSKLTIKRY